MNSPLFSLQFLVLLAVVLVGYFVLVGATRRVAASTRRGGSLLSAAKTTFSAAAFLVPTLMAGVGLFSLASLTEVGGQNPWLSDEDTLLPQCGALLLVALCLAGQVGLLEARRDGRAPDSEDFLAGIRRHAWTFVIAKALWAAAILLPHGGGWSNWEYRMLRLDSLESAWFYLMFLAPSFLLAPVIATASAHPSKPLWALSSSVLFVLRNPWAVARLVVLHFGIVAAGCILLEAGRDTVAFTLTHVSPLGFHASGYIPLMFELGDREMATLLLMGLTAPVFLNAYWSLSNGDLDALPPLERSPVGAPPRAGAGEHRVNE